MLFNAKALKAMGLDPTEALERGDCLQKSPKDPTHTWLPKCVYVLPVTKSIALIIAPVETARNRETMLRSTPNRPPSKGSAIEKTDQDY